MTVIKKIAAVAVTAVLATGVFAGVSGSADAAPRSHSTGKVTYVSDTGWG